MQPTQPTSISTYLHLSLPKVMRANKSVASLPESLESNQSNRSLFEARCSQRAFPLPSSPSIVPIVDAK